MIKKPSTSVIRPLEHYLQILLPSFSNHHGTVQIPDDHFKTQWIYNINIDFVFI